MRVVFATVALILGSIGSSLGYEVYLTPACRMGTCSHALIRNIEPVAFLPKGILKHYDISVEEISCPPASDYTESTCFRKKPAFSKFERAFAFCSRVNPSILRKLSAETVENSSRAYLANYFDFTRDLSTGQMATATEYFTVCHGSPVGHGFRGEPYRTFISVHGYQKPESNRSQISFESPTVYRASLGGASPVTYIGQWYAEGVEACKFSPGEQDNGLIAYNAKRFEGYESSCQIKSVKTRGSRFIITMRCSSEGDVSTVKEVLEVTETTLTRAGRFPVTYRRCPAPL